MSGYTFIYNGRKYWVPQNVPMEKAISYINSEKIGIGGVAGLVAKTINSFVQVADDNAYTYTQVNLPANTPIGITTGQTKSSYYGGYAITQITLTTKLTDYYTAGKRVWVFDSEVNLVAGAEAEGAGFPISQGSRGRAVTQLQNYLKGCGFSLGTWGADGDWGGATQTAISQYNQKNPNSQIPFKVNSQAELNAIISKPCTNASTNTNTGGATTQGGGQTNTNSNNGGSPGKEETKIEVAPQKDNTLLWVGGAFLVKKLFFGKNKKKKR